MINRKFAKRYCCEDICLIENYEQAKKDLLETWHIHHRMENEGYSRQELKDSGMYYGRPASELIFLTSREHRFFHNKHTAEARRKMSLNHVDFKGERNPNYGKQCSEETRKKIGEANKGKFVGEKSIKAKSVHQIDKTTGQIIRTWPCISEVQRVLGIGQSSISKCCSGKYKSAGGYVWRYVNESGGD